MNLMKSILAKNDCYKAGQTMKVRGLMLHSVGCPQPSAQVFVHNWNTPRPNGIPICVHGFIEPGGDVYQTLPWNHRGWHSGGNSNNTHIGIEMTEPATIKYTGGSSWNDLDPINTKMHILGTYHTAVELFAYLCKELGLNPLEDGVVISHKEGCTRGIASNHGDPDHIWGKYSLTMNQFRTDVKAATGGNSPSIGDDSIGVLYRVQVGAFGREEYAQWLEAELKSEGFETCLVEVGGYHKVQIGAYCVKTNADATLAKVKAAGYDGFITAKGGAPAVSAKKSVDEIAQEIINGVWGNGRDRKNRLQVAGYDFGAVQAAVNRLLK